MFVCILFAVFVVNLIQNKNTTAKIKGPALANNALWVFTWWDINVGKKNWRWFRLGGGATAIVGVFLLQGGLHADGCNFSYYRRWRFVGFGALMFVVMKHISVTTIIRAQGNKDLGGSYSGTGSNHHRSVKQCKQWAECRIWFETTEKTLYKSRRIRPRVTQRLGNKNAYNQSHTHRNMYKTKRIRPRVMQRQVFTVLIHWTAFALAAEDKLCKPRHCCICVGCKLQSYASHIFSFLFICFSLCVISLFVGLQLLLIVVMS